MRRFSQRNSLVTLSDINITPLLDLAFVLLIIFVITTPLLEQGMDLRLPVGDLPNDVEIDPRDVRTVEVNPQGMYMLGGNWMSIDQVAQTLIETRGRNPNLIVYIRGHEDGPYKHVANLLYRLEVGGVEQVSLRTRPGN
jgi:biopolymer transport protein ExbD